MAQNLAVQSKKLIGMPSLTHGHVDTKDRKLETKPIVISDILRIVLLTSAFLLFVTFSFQMFLLTGIPGHTLRLGTLRPRTLDPGKALL